MVATTHGIVIVSRHGEIAVRYAARRRVVGRSFKLCSAYRTGISLVFANIARENRREDIWYGVEETPAIDRMSFPRPAQTTPAQGAEAYTGEGKEE